VDWDTVFDVQGNPEVKAAFHTEYGREDGHGDFVYLQKTIETFQIEEKKRNELIKEAMDRMMRSGESTAETPPETDEDKNKRRYLLIQQESELDIPQRQKAEPDSIPKSGTVKTFNNVYHHEFLVPAEIYAIEKYRERFNHATCLEDVEAIIDEYRNPQPKIEEVPKKKKHWWQS
jgi:hypothetical protein